MAAPTYLGSAVFAGVGQGLEKAADNIVKLHHMHTEALRAKNQDNYFKYRLAAAGMKGFMDENGHLGPIKESQGSGNAMEFDPELVEKQNPTQQGGALALGGDYSLKSSPELAQD